VHYLIHLSKKHGGKMILRRRYRPNRFIEGAITRFELVQYTPYDEGPEKMAAMVHTKQSERKRRHCAYAEKLVETGAAYHAFDASLKH
jgi:glutamyl-tRNA synthetase